MQCSQRVSALRLRPINTPENVQGHSSSAGAEPRPGTAHEWYGVSRLPGVLVELSAVSTEAVRSVFFQHFLHQAGKLASTVVHG